MSGMEEVTTVDGRGLLCPLPILRLQSSMEGVVPGGEIRILASDAGIERDLPAWCRANGHQLVALTRQGPREWLGVVRKAVEDG